MHIAICDDNIADRKQLERLLKRESDNRRGDGEPFYIDGYGNPESLMRSPMLYEAFFIDMTKEKKNGYDIAMDLIHMGVTVPIVLCISTIQYQEMDLPDNCFCLAKPIRVDELRAILNTILTVNSNKIPHIELRAKEETLYVLEQDIMYICADGRHIHVYLQDGKVVEVAETLTSFYEEISHLPAFLALSHKTIVNIASIANVTFFHVKTKNGCKFFLHPVFRKYTHYMWKKYRQTPTT